MTKPLHVGHASRNGMFAAYMARGGFTANPGAFEHKQGFLDVFNVQERTIRQGCLKTGTRRWSAKAPENQR